MKRSFSLAHLTVLSLAPPQMIEVAARAGYQTVGLRLIKVTETTPGYPLMTDKPMMRATKAAMAATGIGVLDIEFVKITPEIDVGALEPFLAAGAELGARYVITAPYDADLPRLADRLAAIHDLALRYGLRAVLEFFPWTVVPDLAAAVAVVEAAERPELGILVDTLHFNRSKSRLEQLDKIPAARLPFAHVCDAPVLESYTTEAAAHGPRGTVAGRGGRHRYQGYPRPYAAGHPAGAGDADDGDDRRRGAGSRCLPCASGGGAMAWRLNVREGAPPMRERDGTSA